MPRAHRQLGHPSFGLCRRCGVAISGMRNKQYCSTRCRTLAAGKRRREAARAARIEKGLPRSGRTPGRCLVCGAPFVGHVDKRYCSRRCALRVIGQKPEERERSRLKMRRYREKYPERVLEQRRRRRPMQQAYRARWAQQCRDKVRAANARYRMRHPDRNRASQWKHYWSHRDKRLAATRSWRTAHPEKHAHSQAIRRARIAGADGTHTAAQWEALLRSWGGCAYCGVTGVPLTRDHRVPLRRGGSNDITSIVPACRSCNCRKGTLTEDEFRALGPRTSL